MFSNYLVCLEAPICFHVHVTDFILKGGQVFLKSSNRRQPLGFQTKSFTRTCTSPMWMFTLANMNPLTVNTLGCYRFLDQCFTVISILLPKCHVYKGGPVSVCAKGNFIVPSIYNMILMCFHLETEHETYISLKNNTIFFTWKINTLFHWYSSCCSCCVIFSTMSSEWNSYRIIRSDTQSRLPRHLSQLPDLFLDYKGWARI